MSLEEWLKSTAPGDLFGLDRTAPPVRLRDTPRRWYSPIRNAAGAIWRRIKYSRPVDAVRRMVRG